MLLKSALLSGKQDCWKKIWAACPRFVTWKLKMQAVMQQQWRLWSMLSLHFICFHLILPFRQRFCLWFNACNTQQVRIEKIKVKNVLDISMFMHSLQVSVLCVEFNWQMLLVYLKRNEIQKPNNEAPTLWTGNAEWSQFGSINHAGAWPSFDHHSKG